MVWFQTVCRLYAMEVSQRGKVQKTHNAGLVVTILLEVLALVLLCVIECFIR